MSNEQENIEAKLIQQEHRLVAIVRNFISYKNEKGPKRTAAIHALAWKIVIGFLPAAVVGGVGITAIFGVILANRANDLISEQNRLLNIQSNLVEGQRRASQIFELTSILDELGRERQNWLISRSPEQQSCYEQRLATGRHPNATNLRPPPRSPLPKTPPGESSQRAKFCPNASSFTPSNATIGRISALSRSLRPYKYLAVEAEEPNDETNAPQELVEDARSPERAQLLIALINADFDTNLLNDSGVVFDYADLSGLPITDKKIQYKSLRNAYFEKADLSYSDFSGTDFSNAQFYSATIIGTEFKNAILPNPSAFQDANFIGDYTETYFTFAIVRDENWLSDACRVSGTVKEFFCGNWKITHRYVEETYSNDPSRPREIVRREVPSSELRIVPIDYEFPTRTQVVSQRGRLNG